MPELIELHRTFGTMNTNYQDELSCHSWQSCNSSKHDASHPSQFGTSSFRKKVPILYNPIEGESKESTEIEQK